MLQYILGTIGKRREAAIPPISVGTPLTYLANVSYRTPLASEEPVTSKEESVSIRRRNETSGGGERRVQEKEDYTLADI